MISATSRASLNVPRIAFAAVGVACVVLSSWVSSADEELSRPRPSFSDARDQDHPVPRTVAGARAARSDQPGFGKTGRDRARHASCSSISASPAAARRPVQAATFPSATGPTTCRRGVGLAELDRNTPTLMNLRGQRWYGWDGAADSLWSQSLRPIVDAARAGGDAASRGRTWSATTNSYPAATGRYSAPRRHATDDEAVFVNVGKVLAAFQETLISGRTPFDQFRDAVARGESPSS